MYAVLWLIDTVLSLYLFAIVAWVIVSWLVAFNVINTYNQFVAMVMDFLHRITAPVLRPIQKVLPTLGGIDLSPLVLILGIQFLRMFVRTSVAPALLG